MTHYRFYCSPAAADQNQPRRAGFVPAAARGGCQLKHKLTNSTKLISRRNLSTPSADDRAVNLVMYSSKSIIKTT